VEVKSYKEVLDDMTARLKAGRVPKSFAIDHVTLLHANAVMEANPSLDADYGRSGLKATGLWRKVREMCRNLDSNLFAVAHLKAEWANNAQVGVMIDGAKNIEGDVSIVIYLEHAKGTSYPSQARVIKWRRDPEDERGPVPIRFKWTMEEFEKIAGDGLVRKSDPVPMASESATAELRRLLGLIKLDPDGNGLDRKQKAMQKRLIEMQGEFPDDLLQQQAEAAINYCKTLISGE
jgi:hypothetical protein